MTPRQHTSQLIGERRFAEALEPAAVSCAEDPESAAAWWDFGVALKHALRWHECLAACERAIALDPDHCAGPLWNAGIAATALGNWARARTAWAGYGIVIPPGTGPLEMDLGAAYVRIPRDALVFCDRVDPCRARILSVPPPASGHRHGDIVLHDGDSRGQQGDYAVFDELARLVPSAYGTWEVEATCETPADRDRLIGAFDDVDGAIEDWSDNDPHGGVGWSVRRRLGVAALDGRDLKRLRLPSVGKITALD